MTQFSKDDRYQGPHSEAVKLALIPGLSGFESTVCWWLLTGSWHPLWSQFILSVVHLRQIEGMKEPLLQFPGATHEMLVFALNPGEPPREHLADLLETKGIASVGYLEPIDVVHQFEATDEEMVDIADWCAFGCVNGILTPSTDDNRLYYREQWLGAVVKTLAHMRGEEHAP